MKLCTRKPKLVNNYLIYILSPMFNFRVSEEPGLKYKNHQALKQVLFGYLYNMCQQVLVTNLNGWYRKDIEMCIIELEG